MQCRRNVITFLNKIHCCLEFDVCLSIIITFITTLRFLKVFDFTYAMTFPLNLGIGLFIYSATKYPEIQQAYYLKENKLFL